jgi:hypothetical protein
MHFKSPKISKNKIAVFSIFVVIASIFWFLNAMSLEYTTSIKYPVDFYNFPEDVSVQTDYPEFLTLTVKARGFEILRRGKITKPLKIDVRKYAEQEKSDPKKLVIPLKKISGELFAFWQNISVLEIIPETVYLITSKQNVKKVPVKLNINFTTHPLYIQSGDIIIKPDSVYISGTLKQLNPIEAIETEQVILYQIKDTTVTEIKLKKFNQVSLSSSSVQVAIPIERYTENEIYVPIEILNCPDSIKMITFPNEVKVTYKVALSCYKLITKENFKAVVNFEILNIKESDKAPIKLIEQPEHLQSIKIFPENIEYVIEKVVN